MDNGNAPATKADLLDLETRLNERHEILRSEMAHGYHDLKESMRDMQTELLKVFYNFSVSNSKRLTEIEGNEAALRSRLATIEDRLTDLERRIITPPS
jgi:hypothetical protein